MYKKLLILFVTCSLSILIIGGCIDMQSQVKMPAKINYPTKPITMIVPFTAGGAMDLLARVMEKEAIKYLGQPLIIVNKPGGGGTIGWNELVKANPDGYTLGISSIELLTQPLYGVNKFHYPTALEPIAQAATLSSVMVVKSDQPWQNVNDITNYAKQHPGQLKFGHSGLGSISHILGESFANIAGITLEQVPFNGASESTAALLGNHIQIVVSNPSTVKEQIKNDTLRAVAVTGQQRLIDPELAQIPTFKEQGYDIVSTTWIGVAAPKELPPEIKAKLEEGFKAIIADPEFKATIEKLGLQVEYLDSDASKEKWGSDSRKLIKVLQETGVLEQIKAQKN